MESYFLAIELRGNSFKVPIKRKRSRFFWKEALHTINNGESQVISIRRDTGVSEELQLHKRYSEHFKTYLLLLIALESFEITDNAIVLQRAADMLQPENKMILVDNDEHFQLLTNIA